MPLILTLNQNIKSHYQIQLWQIHSLFVKEVAMAAPHNSLCTLLFITSKTLTRTYKQNFTKEYLTRLDRKQDCCSAGVILTEASIRRAITFKKA